MPAGAAVRPTSDRAREALFSILGAAVAGARVLDAYSGTGALGFEALSRGAGRVLFVESDAGALAALRASARALGVEARVELRPGRVMQVLRGLGAEGRFDLVLADPPWAAGEAPEFLPLAARLLAPGGTLVLERDRGQAPLVEVPGLRFLRTASYGRTRLDLYRGAG